MPPNEFTTDFRSALSTDTPPPGLCPDLPDEAVARFAVYRNNVAHSLGRALARRFPVIERLVGTSFFAAMGREFIAAHPPRTPVLQEWGQDFASFLQGFPPVASLPYLPDVARIEWARGRAYHAGDASPITADDLATRETVRLHPSVTVLPLGHPAVSIWNANQPGRDGRITATGPETALIWRRADFSVATITVAPADGAFVAALSQRHPLASAAQLTDPVAMLTLLLREALICEDEEDDT